MTEAARPVEWGLEHERQVHIATVMRYILEGEETQLQAALEFFDRDAGTLMRLLDKLSMQLATNVDEKEDLTTLTGRLYDLRELYTPPPAR